jgi:UrcA family protein
MRTKIVIAIAAAVVGVSPLASPRAEPASADKAEFVFLADLDLGSDAGARAALARIRSSARWLCGGTWSYQDYGEGGRATWNACVAGAVDRAVTEVNQPALTALRASERR